MLARTPIDTLALSASALGISERERAALCRVFDMLTCGQLAPQRPCGGDDASLCADGFDMMVWQRQSPCGTVACIAGWANILDRTAFAGVGSAAWIFSLSAPLTRLFMPGPKARRTPCTPRRAAHALYAFLTTGEAEWGTA